MRCLEIGPGKHRIEGFETLNLTRRRADHVGDARKTKLPDNTFDIVYSSHCIEHVPWFDTQKLLKEWVRIVKPGGWLEVWTVDAYKVAQALVDLEEKSDNPVRHDGWHRYNEERDGYKWVAGRIYAYSSSNNPCDPNWHKALFTPKSLRRHFEAAGLEHIEQMDRSQVRGRDHGWINLGIKGRKPA